MSLKVEDVPSLKVTQLRQELTERGLDSKGRKAVLVERLENALREASSSATTRVNDSFQVGEQTSNTSANQPSESSAHVEAGIATDSASVLPSVSNTSSNPLSVENKQARAERFGIPLHESEEAKRKRRAERFGIVSEEDRKKARAERFGIVSEDEKKLKRKERFGILTEEDKKRHRAERFAAGSNPRRAALTDEQKAKMKDRAERFGMPFKG